MRFYSRLDDGQCDQLHDATLRVLERTGLIVDEPEGLELMRRAGAGVDGNRVRVPARLIDWALRVAPKEVKLYGRDGQPALHCGGYEYSFGAGSDCINCFDHRTGERRRAVLSDVVEAARVQDACENLDFVMSLFTPSDVTPEVMDRHQMAAMLTNATKPVVYVTLNDMTDSKLPDQQAAAEAALTLLADAVSGGHLIHDIGFMGSAYTGSLTQVVLCDDIAGWVKAFLKPIEITDEELGLDAIEQVGPGELFLKHRHTRRHARDRRQPRLFDRRSRADRLAGGAGGPVAAGTDTGLDATAVAATRVEQILAGHEVPALPPAVQAALDGIIAKAEARVRSA